MTVTGLTLGENLMWWKESNRRRTSRARLQEVADIDPGQVIMGVDTARKAGLSSTVIFPTGNLAPEGSIIKATAIDPSVVDEDNIFRFRGTARVFTVEANAIAAIKGHTSQPVEVGEAIILIGSGPLGTGMEETYQITAALKHVPWGKHIPIITDGRFSGVSTGVCIGHVGPEALAGGPIGKLQDNDLIEIIVDLGQLTASVNFVGTAEKELTASQGTQLLNGRSPDATLKRQSDLPADTRLWAALQQTSGGTWKGCIYDVDRILEVLEAELNQASTTVPHSSHDKMGRQG